MMAVQKKKDQLATRYQKQRFISMSIECTEKYAFVSWSSQGDFYSCYNVFRVDISVACDGSDDIKRHSERH